MASEALIRPIKKLGPFLNKSNLLETQGMINSLSGDTDTTPEEQLA